MQIDKYINEGRPRLLLFFCGWSASPLLFHRLEPEDDQDVWIVYDYRTLDFPADLTAYKSITLIAWSLGVWVAEQLLCNRKEQLFEEKIAVNGTGCPIDDLEGIPEVIFQGTIENLNADGLARFNRRMCGSKAVLQQYNLVEPRLQEDVAEELKCLYKSVIQSEPVNFLWDAAWVGLSDRIFPVSNQLTHWKERGVKIHECETSHYSFYLWKRWKELEV